MAKKCVASPCYVFSKADIPHSRAAFIDVSKPGASRATPYAFRAKLTTLDGAVTIAARTTLIAADLILIGVTWRSVPQRKDAMRLASSFAGVLFRNGACRSVSFLVHCRLMRVAGMVYFL